MTSRHVWTSRYVWSARHTKSYLERDVRNFYLERAVSSVDEMTKKLNMCRYENQNAKTSAYVRPRTSYLPTPKLSCNPNFLVA